MRSIKLVDKCEKCEHPTPGYSQAGACCHDENPPDDFTPGDGVLVMRDPGVPLMCVCVCSHNTVHLQMWMCVCVYAVCGVCVEEVNHTIAGLLVE